MAFFKTTCPVDQDTKQWIEEAGRKILDLYGRKYLVQKKQVRPDESFIDWDYGAAEEDADRIMKKLCSVMDIDYDNVDLGFYDEDPNRNLLSRLPHHDQGGPGTAGLYHPGSSGECRIEIEAGQLSDPLALTATLAHEMAHYKLLGEYRLSENDEHLTDLATVFFGLGLFTANAAFRFRQFQDVSMQGWSMSRQGYMSLDMYGFAIALWTRFKNEDEKLIASYLRPDLKAVYRKTLRFIDKSKYGFWGPKITVD